MCTTVDQCKIFYEKNVLFSEKWRPRSYWNTLALSRWKFRFRDTIQPSWLCVFDRMTDARIFPWWRNLLPYTHADRSRWLKIYDRTMNIRAARRYWLEIIEHNNQFRERSFTLPREIKRRTWWKCNHIIRSPNWLFILSSLCFGTREQ